jgi:hypothetical protein
LITDAGASSMNWEPAAQSGALLLAHRALRALSYSYRDRHRPKPVLDLIIVLVIRMWRMVLLRRLHVEQGRT